MWYCYFCQKDSRRGKLYTSTALLPMRYNTMGYTYFYEIYFYGSILLQREYKAPNKFF